MEALTLVALAALAVKIVTVIKSVGKDNNKAITQVVTWAVGFGVMVLGAHAHVTADLVVLGSYRLGDLDVGSLFLAGTALSSVGSFAYDTTKALDNTQTAADPSLLPAAAAPPAAVPPA